MVGLKSPGYKDNNFDRSCTIYYAETEVRERHNRMSYDPKTFTNPRKSNISSKSKQQWLLFNKGGNTSKKEYINEKQANSNKSCFGCFKANYFSFYTLNTSLFELKFHLQKSIVLIKM
ncbi:MAG: hypothetical protein JWQ96_2186 [Segetibacter sp.]|nr:hypothetical protein [Segetibacter sp.]